jgi:hypothetical protein
MPGSDPIGCRVAFFAVENGNDILRLNLTRGKRS